jgi:hypothetical protein
VLVTKKVNLSLSFVLLQLRLPILMCTMILVTFVNFFLICVVIACSIKSHETTEKIDTGCTNLTNCLFIWNGKTCHISADGQPPCETPKICPVINSSLPQCYRWGESCPFNKCVNEDMEFQSSMYLMGVALALLVGIPMMCYQLVLLCDWYQERDHPVSYWERV